MNTQMCPQYPTYSILINKGGQKWRHTRQSSDSDVSESSVASASSAGFPLDDENREEIHCVIAVVRHGDRTPTQKLKTHVWEKDLVDFYEKRCIDGKYDEVKVKLVADLQELLDLVRILIKAYARGVGTKEAIWEVQGGDSFKKLLQMKRVLERWKFADKGKDARLTPYTKSKPQRQKRAKDELDYLRRKVVNLEETLSSLNQVGIPKAFCASDEDKDVFFSMKTSRRASKRRRE
ncbi:hypothetical protein PsorP6_013393 [Peronosclerospora sorghi]|uniref:Uncharacterized protein n=1 Tax=Peronosclerospora sorghi TaxID=230839 RepID=A0ACC0WFN6_9STRA|nr:hypothetical protein PsorP6_013393 [Peronosclerospora sorghi]